MSSQMAALRDYIHGLELQTAEVVRPSPEAFLEAVRTHIANRTPAPPAPFYPTMMDAVRAHISKNQ
jgi:hypothetical protein